MQGTIGLLSTHKSHLRNPPPTYHLADSLSSEGPGIFHVVGCVEESTEDDAERHDEENDPRGFYWQVHLVDLLQKFGRAASSTPTELRSSQGRRLP